MIPLIPAPLHLETREGEPYQLAAGATIVAPPDLDAVAAWFTSELERLTGLFLTIGSGEGAIRLVLDATDPKLANLPTPAGVRADNGDPAAERHALAIDADGVRITGATPEGVLRGVVSLLQIAATGSRNPDGTILLPLVSIADAPRFAWRGLSLDVVRRAFPVEEVKQVIDLLALYKANVLHLHLTDSEGWRIEIDAWPKLTEVAGQTAANNRPGLFYTKADFAGLVQYAADRFITIVPEIEMPGHTAAIFRSYPELAGDGETTGGDVMTKSHHLQTMDPDNPRIVPFIADVLTEVAAMTPGGYLHIGGDEALGMDGDQYRRFMQEVKQIVGRLGKNVVAWQETARSGFAPGDIAQLWISPNQGQPEALDLDTADLPEGFELPADGEQVLVAFAEFLKLANADLDAALGQGAHILVSQQSRCYLDTKYREGSSDPAQAADHHRLGMPFYPKSTVTEFYDWDPATVRPQLTEANIAGIEAAIWCETIESFADACFLLLPRLPGVLEKGWSAAGGGARTWEDYAPRLSAQASIWDACGWPWFRSEVVWRGDA